MLGLFKQKVSADWLGAAIADVVVTTNTRLQSEAPNCGVPAQKIFDELTFLDTFLFTQAVGRVFSTLPIQQRILKAYVARLVVRNSKTSVEGFLRQYGDRQQDYGLGWSPSPGEPAFTHVAGQACMRCEATHYTLLMFFTTRALASYGGALDLLNDRNAKYKIE
jgi:hypothetical protein